MGLHICRAEAVASSQTPDSRQVANHHSRSTTSVYIQYVHPVQRHGDSHKLAWAIHLPQGWGGGSKIRKKNTHSHTSEWAQMSGHRLHRLGGHGGKTSRASSKMWNIWRHLLPPLWKMLVLHAGLSGGLRLCLSLAGVLSGARLGMTRLFCLEAAGGILGCVGADSGSRGERLSSMAGRTVQWGGRRALFSSEWEEHGQPVKDNTHQLATPSAQTSPFHVLFTLHENK